jgi:hypothetical protein
MSDQQSNSGALVNCRQMAKADFQVLSVKDPFTIYFVNETGVFTEQSLEEEGDIYLGGKLLTRKYDLTDVVKVNGAALVLNDFTGSSFTEEFELSSALANAAILDFFLHATVQHVSNTAVNVECSLELGHYEENKYVTDHVVVSGQDTLAAARNEVPVWSVISMAGTIGGASQSKFLRIRFGASGTIAVKRYTESGIDRASQLLIRVYTAINT